MTSSLQKVTVNKDFINDIIKEMNNTIEKLKGVSQEDKDAMKKQSKNVDNLLQKLN